MFLIDFNRMKRFCLHAPTHTRIHKKKKETSFVINFSFIAHFTISSVKFNKTKAINQ